jgi:hypothetical protein
MPTGELKSPLGGSTEVVQGTRGDVQGVRERATRARYADAHGSKASLAGCAALNSSERATYLLKNSVRLNNVGVAEAVV